MCILHKIHSLNGSDVPPAASLPTPHQRTDRHQAKRARLGFFLRWIFGKWADSGEHKCYEVQLPSHKAFFLIFLLLSALSDRDLGAATS